MSPDVGQFAEVAAVIVAMVGSFALIFVATFFVVKRVAQTSRPRVDDQRLEQLQQSVDAIAIEVERIAEAQRFSAKLLAERAPEVPDSQLAPRVGSVKR